jgi:hypothetical protein
MTAVFADTFYWIAITNIKDDEGITDALTNDAHFEQEGFRALFRRS